MFYWLSVVCRIHIHPWRNNSLQSLLAQLLLVSQLLHLLLMNSNYKYWFIKAVRLITGCISSHCHFKAQRAHTQSAFSLCLISFPKARGGSSCSSFPLGRGLWQQICYSLHPAREGCRELLGEEMCSLCTAWSSLAPWGVILSPSWI